MRKEITTDEILRLAAEHLEAKTMVDNATPGTTAHRERVRECDRIFRRLTKVNQDFIKQRD